MGRGGSVFLGVAETAGVAGVAGALAPAAGVPSGVPWDAAGILLRGGFTKKFVSMGGDVLASVTAGVGAGLGTVAAFVAEAAGSEAAAAAVGGAGELDAMPVVEDGLELMAAAGAGAACTAGAGAAAGLAGAASQRENTMKGMLRTQQKHFARVVPDGLNADYKHSHDAQKQSLCFNGTYLAMLPG